MNESIGDRIKRLRLIKGMTQQEIADIAGVSRAAVTQWESGVAKGLRPENLLPVAKVLGVSVEYLVTGDDKTPGAELPVLDTELLVVILQAIKIALNTRHIELPPEKEARLIELLYTHYLKTGEKVEKSHVLGLIELAK